MGQVMTRSSSSAPPSITPPKNWVDWLKKFVPISGPTPNSTEWAGLLFPHDHPTVVALHAKSPGRIWTLLDVEGKPVVTTGLARTHRIGCFITEVEYTGGLCDFFWNDKDKLIELELEPNFKSAAQSQEQPVNNLLGPLMTAQRCE